MIGAKDMAFPKLNAIAFWLLPPAGLLLLSSLFIPAGSAQAGWWSYPPISTQVPQGVVINGESLWLISIFLIGVSSLLGAVNFLSTIVWMRAPGMTFFRMPIFVWTILSAQLLQLLCLPALTGAGHLTIFDLNFGTTFFQPFAQGSPVLYQHLFWFYSHPAVYVMVLPSFGIFSEIIPAFTRSPPVRLSIGCTSFDRDRSGEHLSVGTITCLLAGLPIGCGCCLCLPQCW